MPKLKVYQYSGCSTCKKALKFLDSRGVAYDAVSITEQPPTAPELRRMLELSGGNVRKLFNTSGQLYRELKLGDKLPGMSVDEALRLLARHGKLVKRPFVVGGPGTGLVGFNEAEWKKAFK